MKIKNLIIILITIILANCTSLLQDMGQPTPKIIPANEAIVDEDTKITITFDEEMDTQITEKSFSLSAIGKGKVSGRISWSNSNKKMIFTPSAILLPNQRYQIALSKSAEDKSGNDLEKNYIKYFNVVGKQTDRPELISSTPSHMESGVGELTTIELIFSKPIDRKTINMGVSLSSGSFTTQWFDSDSRVILTPINELKHGNTYTITVNDLLFSMDGNKFYPPKKEIVFTVGDEFIDPKITQLAIERISDNALNVLYEPLASINWEGDTYKFDDQNDFEPNFLISFDKEIDQASFANNFSFSVPYTITWITTQQVRIDLSTPLEHGKIYNIALNQSIKDTNNNPLYKNYSFNFRMGTDLTPLTLQSLTVQVSGQVDQNLLVNPDISTIGNNANKPVIRVEFNNSVDTSSFESNFSTSPSISNKTFTWSTTANANDTVTITFDEELVWHQRYELSFSEAIKGINKNNMEKKDFYMSIGLDYTNPIIDTNGVLATGGSQAPTDIILDTLTQTSQIEKKDHFLIKFVDASPMDMESLSKGVYLKNWNSNATITLHVVQDNLEPYLFHFYPKSSLESSETYELVITNEITDLQGNVLNEVSTTSKIYYKFVVDAQNSSLVEIVEPATPINGGDNSKTWIDADSDGHSAGVTEWNPLVHMKGVANLVDDSGNLVCKDWILIHFNKQLDVHTVLRNISVTAFNDIGTVTINPQDIIVNADINGNNSPTETNVIIKKMTFSSSDLDSVYVLNVVGGDDGIKDKFGNKMKNSFEIRFKIQQ